MAFLCYVKLQRERHVEDFSDPEVNIFNTTFFLVTDVGVRESDSNSASLGASVVRGTRGLAG